MFASDVIPVPTSLPELLCEATRFRQSPLLPVVLPRIVEAMQNILPKYWQFVTLPDPNEDSTLAVKCTLGKTLLNSETFFRDPVVSKLAALDSEGCILGVLLEDRPTGRIHVNVAEPVPFRAARFIEQVFTFLSASGGIMVFDGSREDLLKDFAKRGLGAIAKMPFPFPKEEYDAAMLVSAEANEFFERVQPKLREVQKRLSEEIRVWDSRRSNHAMSRGKLSRNAPCPCGSGRKYKHCCLGKGFDNGQESR